MEKIFLIFALLNLPELSHDRLYANFPYISDSCEVKEEDNSNEFWPADMVPHPHPPWQKPRKSDETDLA